MQKIHHIPFYLFTIFIFLILLNLPVQAATETVPIVESLAESAINPVIEADPMETMTNNNTEFALVLYRELSESEDNLFFSPYSISTALGMTYAGAKGDTETQMARAMRFSLPQDQLHKTMNLLDQNLNKIQNEGDITLNTANALWIQQDFKLLASFLGRMQTYYKAPPHRVDFIKAPQKACETVNAWVSEKTVNKIPELLSPKAITPLTRMVLTNAIYFYGQWALAFDPARTQDAPFFLDNQATVTTPFMALTDSFLYTEDEDVQVLHLPYKGDRLNMVLILPKQTEGFLQIEKNLTPERLYVWLTQSQKSKVEVYLPKFKLASEYYLSQTFSDMGMPDAFDADLADFSGMDGTQSLFISSVIHKAFVEVNEKGTEAAAATAVVMTLRSIAAPAPVFRADHPFIFLIRDIETESVLFMGRVADLRK